MFEETLYQSTADGKPFVDVLRDQGIVPGIKVDTGESEEYDIGPDIERMSPHRRQQCLGRVASCIFLQQSHILYIIFDLAMARCAGLNVLPGTAGETATQVRLPAPAPATCNALADS